MNVWRIIELSPPAAAALAWRQWLGPESGAAAAACLKQTQRRTDRVPCPHGCGCGHRVIATSSPLLAVCDCEEGDCEDLLLQDADRVVWEVDLAKLGRGIVRALGCDARDGQSGVEGVRQIGSFGAVALPILLTVPRDAAGLRSVVGQLVARLKGKFVLWLPTGRFVGAETQELLAGVGAQFFDLESHLHLMEGGTLAARKRAGELFSGMLPPQEEEVSEEELRRMYAQVVLIAKKEKGGRAAPLKEVFDYYCLQGFTAQEVAVKLHCSKATVIDRLDEIEKATGKRADELREFKSFFEGIEESLTDSRARRISRRGAIYGEDPEEE